MDRKEILVIILIGVMLLAVGLQTIQLAGLTSAQVVAPAAGGTSVKTPVSGSSPSVPTNLQNIPSMVGGC
jgi:hypothetical protein